MRRSFGASEDEFDDFFGYVIGEAKVGAGDRDETEHHSGRLGDVAPVGPLRALQLGPAGAQERDGSVAATQGSARGPRVAAVENRATAVAATITSTP